MLKKSAKMNMYKKIKCKYCDVMMNDSTCKMTIKMIIQTDQSLLRRGYEKDLDFLHRYSLKNVDLINLYEEHKVCKKCYMLYKETEKLMEVEHQLNKLMGIPMTKDTKHDLLELTMQDINDPSFKEKLKFKYDNQNRV